MINFTATIEKFEHKGEKTGWTFVFVPKEIANKIKPNEKKSFRIKGFLDHVAIAGVGLVPMGEGDFILSLNADLRKKLKKELGAILNLSLTFDKDFKIEMPFDLEICLAEDEVLLVQFLNQPKGHQNYFINWLNTAKTEPTRTKRLVMIIRAIAKKQDFGAMIRENKNQ